MKETKEDLFSRLKCGGIRIVTNRGEIVSDSGLEFDEKEEALLETAFAKVILSVYEKGGNTVYRSIRLLCKEELILYRIEFVTNFGQTPFQFIDYKSFLNAPAAAFVRYDNIGFYTGIENPFFSAMKDEHRVVLSYEPSLILKKGEVYESEPQFMGCYECSGEFIKEKEPINLRALERGIRRPRYFNPCGEIALDLAEVNAMREYVAEYYNVIQRQFDNILYFFFYPKKQYPKTKEEIQDYFSTIDRFKEMSGDIIAFNPHVNTAIPTEEKPYWELTPADSAAEQILQYAKAKGLRCGYYMGCAFNGDGGNAALLPFMPEKKEWKKIDEFGNTASENCLGCDEYLEWWYRVQKNTIEKYDLGYWAWDPGPGNGNDCYAENHGHLPGKGEYKGWRNSQKLLSRMKAEFPELFLMSFYGRKEYGIWGFRYFSQHEVYWEQTVLFGATLHNDIHDDRINAHGTRLQNQWCMNFRFLPAQLGHGLVPRMGESWFDPSMDQACDFGGFRYALLSAIACCGSVTHCTIPDRLDRIPGYTEFYKKWIHWAKENYEYCEFTRPIGDCVSNEIIDGFSRINRDKGQIFLFNSSPKVMNKKLVLDQKLGFDTKEGFYLQILYCESFDVGENKVRYRGEYHMGDVLDITLPPYGAVVLECKSSETGCVQEAGSRSVGSCLEPSEAECGAAKSDEMKCMMELPQNTHSIDVFLDSEGTVFDYPIHKAYDTIKLTAHAVFHEQLKQVLERSHVDNEEFLTKKITEWHENGMPFTFTSALPHRLVMYIPFDGPKLPKKVTLFINETEVPVEVFKLREIPVFHYAFIEDYVKWGCENRIKLELKELAQNSFLGIHVDYPDLCDGIDTEKRIFPERFMPSELYSDPVLRIDSFTLTPEVLSDQGGVFTVTIDTNVDPERIESVYFVHPTEAVMAELIYDQEKRNWSGTFEAGARKRSIFCNTTAYAWIKAKDGGVGPRAECNVKLKYAGSERN